MKITEERWLSERFGEEYKAYSKQVNRFIPWKKIHNQLVMDNYQLQIDEGRFIYEKSRQGSNG